MVTFHLYAKNEDEAILITRRHYSPRVITVVRVYLDIVWKNPYRWCVDISFDLTPN